MQVRWGRVKVVMWFGCMLQFLSYITFTDYNPKMKPRDRKTTV